MGKTHPKLTDVFYCAKENGFGWTSSFTMIDFKSEVVENFTLC